MSRGTTARRATRAAIGLAAAAAVTAGAVAFASREPARQAHATPRAIFVKAATVQGVRETTAAIDARQARRSRQLSSAAARASAYRNPPGGIGRPRELEVSRPMPHSAPSEARALAQWPPPPGRQAPAEPSAPQTVDLTFDGVTGPTDTGAFPPDTMGAVGPTQFLVFVNGRIRTFNKSTGVADGVTNVDADVFFASVLTTPGANEVVFTSDPNVRYDRLTGRWFLTIIDVPLNTNTGLARANRVLIAVSDAASSNALTAGTTWTFYQFNGDGAGTRFTDYPSLGIDAMALYIGANMFSATTGGFSNSRALIIPKAPFLTASAITIFAANNLISTSGAFPGPFAPRGVDNPDPSNTGNTATGYFIGTDFGSYNKLTLRRVTNPGAVSGSPTITGNIQVTTPLTTNYDFNTLQPVPHLGNAVVADTDGNGYPDGNLDSLDDRLYAAVMRNGRLWTAHNIGVNSSGAATNNAASNTANNDRIAARWYELENLGTATPTVRQSGTLFDNAAANPRHYWIPSIAVSGQGHAAIGTSIAGNNERVNAFTTGRLAGDTLGTMSDGSPGTPAGYTATTFAYNPPGDPGGAGAGRRWGDYSFVSLDPLDDMTLWTIQEYTNGLNTYGVRAAKLLAPPPADPTGASPSTISPGIPSINVTITGTVVSGSGFYDPGADLASPALPFNHVSASVTGGITVNSVTYTSPTSVTLDVSTVGASAGPQDVTITNPDGQSKTGTGLITIAGPTSVRAARVSTAGARQGVVIRWRTGTEAGVAGFNVYRGTARLNRRVIPAAGSPNGHAYSWLDRTKLRGRTYRIQGVLTSGAKVWLGAARS